MRGLFGTRIRFDGEHQPLLKSCRSSASHTKPSSTTIYIPELTGFLGFWDQGSSGWITVNDVGEGLCHPPVHSIDLFVGEGEGQDQGWNAFLDLLDRFPDPVVVYTR